MEARPLLLFVYVTPWLAKYSLEPIRYWGIGLRRTSLWTINIGVVHNIRAICHRLENCAWLALQVDLEANMVSNFITIPFDRNDGEKIDEGISVLAIIDQRSLTFSTPIEGFSDERDGTVIGEPASLPFTDLTGGRLQKSLEGMASPLDSM